MNWLLILLCFMFLAVLADPASADTVTAAIGTALVSNPTYALTIAVICILGLAFFGLLWWAAGSDRPKIKAELLHTPQKPVEPPSVFGQLMDAARVYGPNEYATVEEANEVLKAMEPTWEIREVYDRGEVRWYIYRFCRVVKVSFRSECWKIKEERAKWGSDNGYPTKLAAELHLQTIFEHERQVVMPREVIQYDRNGNPVGKPL